MQAVLEQTTSGARELVARDFWADRINFMRVLVIEDDEETAAYMVKGLKESGYIVDHAKEGRDGLFHAMSASHDVLIIDRMLPNVDGLSIVQALRAAGVKHPGHTELLAERCRASNVAMMLYLPPGRGQVRGPVGLGVIHVTLHTALRNVFGELSHSKIVDRCRLASDGVPRAARVGVAALNPHGGENGLFGQEELELIGPAVEAAKSSGLPVSGPWPCDTLMHRAAGGEFDAVVAMYHDQGHIALKLLGLHDAVNVTLGLPIIRTSVAHGTAFDIAWKGRASPYSMIQATLTALDLCTARPSE